MAWITTKDGRQVNTDWFDEEEKKKYSQIEQNQAEGKEKTTTQNLEDKYKNINPRYKKDAKTNFENDGFNNNCVMCAIAFEANMRGQDVEANPFKFGDLDSLDRSRNPQKAFNQKDVWDIGKSKREQAIREIELNMQDWGRGSRAIIQEDVKGRRHAMNVINLDGKVIIVNAQNGTHGTVAQMLKGINTKGMVMFRTDNQEIDSSYSDWAYRKRG